MLNPEKHADKYQKYFSEALGAEVEILKAEALHKSSREAPWRFDLLVNGEMKSFVLRADKRSSAREYKVLKVVETLPVPAPRVYGLDKKGIKIGTPCFFMDFIEGESLLKPMLAGESWADDLYIECAIRLQNTLEKDMGEMPDWLERENAEDVLDKAYKKLKVKDDLVARRVYQELKLSVPDLPEVRFSNGDLYPDNFVIKDRKLVAVIDFANAAFSDPLYEFLLPFFIHPELRGRGTEERYCTRIGMDPSVLSWYHVLEFYDLWGWLEGTDESFSGYNAGQLREILKNWLKTGKLPQSGGRSLDQQAR